MKDPRSDNRPPSDTGQGMPETDLDPMVGVPSGFRGGPTAPTRVDAEPGAPDEGTDPNQERVAPDRDAPELRPAVLGVLEGTGLMLVTRSAEGAVVRVDGTWRPGDESVGRAELEATFPEGSTVRFVGTRVEARGAHRAEVAVDVVIERHATYETDDGRTLRVVRFAPRDGA